MPKVVGSSGKVVTYEISGIEEVRRQLEIARKDITGGIKSALLSVGVATQGEVKDSIAGNRAEQKSVRTGLFLNNIEFSMPDDYTAVIAPADISYPNGISLKTVANWMEYGTSRKGKGTGITPRRHFRNTRDRQEKKIYESTNKFIKKALQGNILANVNV